MQVNELKAFNDVLNQLVSDYRTPIDEKIGKENMISIKLFQLYISFQELKEKRDAQKDSLRNIKPVDAFKTSQSAVTLSKGENNLKRMGIFKPNVITTENKEISDIQKDNPSNKKPVDSSLVSDRQDVPLSPAERQEKAKRWLNRLENNASWLTTEELAVLAVLNERSLTINVENEGKPFTISSSHQFEKKVTVEYKNNHYERVINNQAQDTVGDGYCGWHALFGEKNDEGKFELRNGKPIRNLFIRAAINNIDYCIEDLYEKDLLNDLMLDELISHVRN